MGTNLTHRIILVKSPNWITYGFNATDELGSFATDGDVESVLLVTDSDIDNVGVTAPVEATLREAGTEVNVFDA